ncbi:YjdF family protein [Paenibacillus donghaensis]|uniref:YjdF family protein n=1 Tax=Paenibacillus donghaensis TaxID=414771 RepID=UPI0018845B59|nr:YjdF family protein [Paenibacillus donghaensis]MBE9914471.1 YjdF family protein [Paenibacillus donghaensis]
MKLTVFFDEPYWVGVVEVESGGKVMAGKHTFGAEPSLQQVWEFVLQELPALVERLSVGVTANKAPRKAVNPKRLARLATRETRSRGVSSASQEAMRLELEKRKQERSRLGKEQREALAARKREIAVRKAKAKHRGR